MKPSKMPEWYEGLKKPPFQEKTFTSEMMRTVVQKAELSKNPGIRSWNKIWIAGMSAAAVAMLLIAGVWYQQKGSLDPIQTAPPVENIDNTPLNPPVAAPTEPPSLPLPGERLAFDPGIIKVDDKVGVWKVTEKKEGTWGKGSIETAFTGKAELSGTFQYTNSRNEYNPNQILLILDAASKAKLPAFNKPFNNTSDRVVVQMPENMKSQFGVPGRTGKVKLQASAYTTVSAEILEGTPDRITLNGIIEISLDQMKPALELTPEINAAFTPFQQLPPGDQLKISDADKIFPWIQQVHNNFNTSINKFSGLVREESVSPQVKDHAFAWLTNAMTDDLANEIMSRHFQPYLGGFNVYSGISQILPVGEIKGTENPRLTFNSKVNYTFSVKLIATGSYDYQFTCTLVNVEGKGWRIQSFSNKAI